MLTNPDTRNSIRIQPPEPAPAHITGQFSKNMKSPRFMAELLMQRGIDTLDSARSYFLADDSSLSDANTFKNYQDVIDALLNIRKNKERILVHGDYDVDGVAGAAVLFKGLEKCGFDVDWFLPNRFTDGYGITVKNVEKLYKKGFKWIITVDTGITAHKEVTMARNMGMGVIITDHHQVGESLPETPYIINPNQPKCNYPNKGLCGTGVAYQIIRGLSLNLLNREPEYLLDLVAIATLADISPLTDENRHLVKRGLKILEQGSGSVGLFELLNRSGLTGTKLTSNDILFKITPMINSAGRLDSPDIALELCLTEEKSLAMGLSEKLFDLNNRRKQLDKNVFQQACLQCESFKSDVCLVLGSEDWHEGVIGIVAAKMVDRYQKPVFILSVNKGMAKGSCRTVEGIDLHNTLGRCSDLLEKWGGHYYAGGFSILEKNIDKFRQRLNRILDKEPVNNGTAKTVKPHIKIDLGELNEDSLAWLDRMEPTGPQNELPLFFSSQVTLQAEPRIVGGDHLKLSISQGGAVFPAIGFGLAHYHDSLATGAKLEIAYYPEWNSFRGIRNIQLRLIALETG